MSSEVECMMGEDEDFSGGFLLRDIEEISKALYLHKNKPNALSSSSVPHPNVATRSSNLESKSKVTIQGSSHKDKKSSIWNWKPLKALAHIRNDRFNCYFFLHVHVVEGLPANFNNLNLCVTWKRKGDVLQTQPARVCLGMAEFEETLMHQCTVYASRSGHQNLAKYEPKLFLLHTSVIGSPTLDIGKHWIDLTRLLPLTLDELQGEKRSSGRWTTSFKLTGKAEGAVLNVSFGFSILDGNSFDPAYFVKVPDIVSEGGAIAADHYAGFDNSRTSQLHSFGTVPTVSTQGSRHQSLSTDIKFLDEIITNQGVELRRSITLLYQKLDDGKMGNVLEFDFFHEPLESLKLNSDPSPESAGENYRHECSGTETDVEVSMKDPVRLEQQGSHRFDSSLVEIINIEEIFKEEETYFDENVECNSNLDTNDHANNETESATDDTICKYNSRSIKEPSTGELDSAFYGMFTPRSMESESLLDINKFYEQENSTGTMFSYNTSKLAKSLSLDDIAESIENDFLNMLSIEQTPAATASDSGPESPRDRLLRQFGGDAVAWKNLLLDTDFMAEQQETCCLAPSGYDRLECADEFDLSFHIQAVERNHVSLTQSTRTKRNAKILENQETESLMHEWGLNENAFQNSPCISSSGFGSPVYLPAEEPLKLPSLGEGLGPIVQSRDGGFLRSMNPLLFRNANNGARLIVQVSAPVVLPAAMGFTIMEVLQCWASGGVEKMSTQAKDLMPLEDVTGKTIQQVVSESKSELDSSQRSVMYSCSMSEDMKSEYVTGENLVPVAMTNIEGLLIEGLKVQSGMQDKEAPSSIKIQFAGKTAKLCGNYASERASGLEVRDVDELVKYSVSLKEWMRLDSGDFDSKAETDENIQKLLAAHHAKTGNLSSEQLIWEDEGVKLLGRRYGVFSDNFWMALKVQLRDPFRNYEMVGSSMLALIQVNRAYSPLQPGPQFVSPEKNCNAEEEGLDEKLSQEGIDFKTKQDCGKGIPQFKALEAHLAGSNVLLANKQLWGTSRQHQSGSRWLLSSGLARTNKHPISNSNAIIKPSSTTMRGTWQGDVLWSISSHTRGEAATWDEQVALNVHVRNPDIICPNESPNYPQK